MSQEIFIRPFRSADAQAFHDLNLAWISAFFQPEAKDEANLLNPEGTIVALGGRIFVAELDRILVGCVALLPMPGAAYEVAKMAVAPQAQGRGVGRRLLAEAVAWAQAQGAERLYLESNHVLAPALRLYESAGFLHLPPERRPVSPYARADVFMEMLLEDTPDAN